MKFPTLKPFAGDKPLAIELLKAAKENIAVGGLRYLCNAVQMESPTLADIDDEEGYRKQVAADEVECWIGSMCERHRENGSKVVDATQAFKDSAKEAGYTCRVEPWEDFAINYRLAWADHLISYLETSQ